MLRATIKNVLLQELMSLPFKHFLYADENGIVEEEPSLITNYDLG